MNKIPLQKKLPKQKAIEYFSSFTKRNNIPFIHNFMEEYRKDEFFTSSELDRSLTTEEKIKTGFSLETSWGVSLMEGYYLSNKNGYSLTVSDPSDNLHLSVVIDEHLYIYDASSQLDRTNVEFPNNKDSQ